LRVSIKISTPTSPEPGNAENAVVARFSVKSGWSTDGVSGNGFRATVLRSVPDTTVRFDVPLVVTVIDHREESNEMAELTVIAAPSWR
jgi:hypothetical protein